MALIDAEMVEPKHQDSTEPHASQLSDAAMDTKSHFEVSSSDIDYIKGLYSPGRPGPRSGTSRVSSVANASKLTKHVSNISIHCKMHQDSLISFT